VRLEGEVISIANSSDPYPNLEAKTGLTRKCLEILSQQDCRIQVITKSNMVVRDIDLLAKIPSMVSVTITTDDDDLAKVIEPHAPSPLERLKAAETLIKKGIPTSVRIDPIIPSLNDNPESLIKILASMGVRHVTVSTYKVKPDDWQRFSVTMPKVAEKLKKVYFEKGEKIARYTYLPRDFRRRLMENLRSTVERCGMKFGICRENLSHLNTASCDGSWLLYSR
jgi:DNA repair photolyase